MVGKGDDFITNSIREHRKAKGLTQAELARSLGVCQSAISQIEKGFRNPSALLLLKLSEVLEAPIDALIGKAG